MKARIVILNYNGADLLRRYLPSFVRAAARASVPCTVTVLDNASRDDSKRAVEEFGKAVTWMPSPKNRVLCSYNEAAKEMDDDVLIFMNNDIRVDEGFVDPLVKPFAAAGDVFFVTPKCLSMKDGRYEGNKTKGCVRYGVFWSSAMYRGHEKHVDRFGFTLQGGFGAFDRRKFLEMGGYDDLYLPGRLEDADICFRAYKKGWKCFYEPKSVVFHEGGTSFHKSFGERGTLVINWRNTFLFMWKNLNDQTNFGRFPAWLPVRLVYSLVTGKYEFALGLMKALPLYSKARARRHAAEKNGNSASDREIFEKSVRECRRPGEPAA